MLVISKISFFLHSHCVVTTICCVFFLSYHFILWEEWDGRGMWHVWGKGEGCTGFWWGNLRERDHWGGPDADGKIILRWIFRKSNCIIAASDRPHFINKRSFTYFQSDDTRCCNNTIWPSEDEHSTARNMSRIIMWHIYCYRIKKLPVPVTARSEA